MKLKIWTEESKNDLDDEQLYVRLIKSNKEDIALIACKKDGEVIDAGNILFIDNDCKYLIPGMGLNECVPLITDILGCALMASSHDILFLENKLRTDKLREILMTHHKEECEECSKEDTKH